MIMSQKLVYVYQLKTENPGLTGSRTEIPDNLERIHSIILNTFSRCTSSAPAAHDNTSVAWVRSTDWIPHRVKGCSLQKHTLWPESLPLLCSDQVCHFIWIQLAPKAHVDLMVTLTTGAEVEGQVLPLKKAFLLCFCFLHSQKSKILIYPRSNVKRGIAETAIRCEMLYQGHTKPVFPYFCLPLWAYLVSVHQAVLEGLQQKGKRTNSHPHPSCNTPLPSWEFLNG